MAKHRWKPTIMVLANIDDLFAKQNMMSSNAYAFHQYAHRSQNVLDSIINLLKLAFCCSHTSTIFRACKVIQLTANKISCRLKKYFQDNLFTTHLTFKQNSLFSLTWLRGIPVTSRILYKLEFKAHIFENILAFCYAHNSEKHYYYTMQFLNATCHTRLIWEYFV